MNFRDKALKEKELLPIEGKFYATNCGPKAFADQAVAQSSMPRKISKASQLKALRRFSPKKFF